MLYIFWLLRHKSSLVTCVSLNTSIFDFCEQEMRYCSNDAPRTGERNVNVNKHNKSKNVASIKKYLIGCES